jgi:HK97 family phage major capsid protein
MSDLTPELISQLTKSASELETFVSEFKQRKQNEYDAELKALEKSRDEAVQKMADEQAALRAEIAELKSATRPPIDDQSSSEYKCFADWLAKTLTGKVERKDMGEASGGVGGYMVPDQFIADILKIPMEQGVARTHGATIIPMASDTAKIPALNADSHATNFYGGMLGYWLAEANTITASAWTAKEVSLEANVLAAVGKVSKQLLADSPLSMSAVIERSFGEVLTFMEDEAFIRGNGTNQPHGIIGAGCEVAVSRAVASKIDEVDILGMLAQFLGRESRACWVANRAIIPELYALTDAGSNNIFIPNAGPSASPTLLGMPIVWSENASTLGTKGDLMLCDWSYYVIGDRQQIVVDWADQLYFLTIQDAVRLYERVDGTPWMDATYTPRKGSARSPFVILN